MKYLRAADTDIDITTLRPVDQHSQAARLRIRISKPEELRFVGNDHWRFALRRAFYRAQADLNAEHGIAKRSIRFASDEVKYRDWSHGTDYVEIALTRPTTDDDIGALLNRVRHHTDERFGIGEWKRHPLTAVGIRSDVHTIFYEVEIDEDHDHVANRLHWWNTQKTVDTRLAVQGGYFAPNSETVNAKDYVDQLWLIRRGHRLHLRMLVRPRPNPYNIVAALLGKPSWFPYAKHPARRLDIFVPVDDRQQDFLHPSCEHCQRRIPVNILDVPHHPRLCPPCQDTQETAHAVTAG